MEVEGSGSLRKLSYMIQHYNSISKSSSKQMEKGKKTLINYPNINNTRILIRVIYLDMLIRQYSICKDITNKSQEEEKVNTIKVYNSIIIMINISCSITTKYIIYTCTIIYQVYNFNYIN